jgi:hypothetical protein
MLLQTSLTTNCSISIALMAPFALVVIIHLHKFGVLNHQPLKGFGPPFSVLKKINQNLWGHVRKAEEV